MDPISYETHEYYHLMICMRDKVFFLFLTISTMFVWAVEIVILSHKLFKYARFNLLFTWVLVTWGLLGGGSVALQHTWNLLSFSSPELG